MEYTKTDRRLRFNRRLTTRLLLRITLWSVSAVLIVLVISFALSFYAAKENRITELANLSEQRINIHTEQFRQAERSAAVMADRFLTRYQAFADHPQFAANFSAWHHETEPGVFRLKPEFHDGIAQSGSYFQHLSSFVGPRQEPLSDELKARIVIAELVLNELGPAWHGRVANSHISMPENIIAVYSQTHPWGLLAASDLVITDFSVVRSTLQEHNPERQAAWTGLYYDLSAEYWTITYQLPVDYAGQHLINASHDVALNEMLPALIEPEQEGVQHFLFNQNAQLIAAAETLKETYQQKGILAVDKLTNPIYAAIYAEIAEHGFHQAQFILQEAVDGQVLIAKRLDGLDWWHVTLYPYKNIQQAALWAPLKMAVATLALLGFILLLVYLMINRHVSKPLRQLSDMAVLIGDKKYQQVISSELLTEHARSEVGLLVRSFRTMATRLLENQQNLETLVEKRTAQLAEANAKLEQMAHLDGLTGLLNRRAFDAHIKRAHQQAQQSSIGLLFCDLDFFKQYNDHYGHQAGDEALIAVAKCLQDIDVGQVYRYGGEELALLVELPEQTNQQPEQQARALAERLRTAVLALNIEHALSNHNNLSMSIGVHVLNPNISIAENLIAADEKLYAAKNAGRNQVC